MTKLKATIAVLGDRVAMQIREMDERFRNDNGSLYKKSYKSDNGFSVISGGYPKLDNREVFLCGVDITKDHDVLVRKLGSESSAIEYAKMVVEALEDWSQNWEGFKSKPVKKVPANELFYELEL